MKQDRLGAAWVSVTLTVGLPAVNQSLAVLIFPKGNQTGVVSARIGS